MENCSWERYGLISEYIEPPSPNVKLVDVKNNLRNEHILVTLEMWDTK